MSRLAAASILLLGLAQEPAEPDWLAEARRLLEEGSPEAALELGEGELGPEAGPEGWRLRGQALLQLAAGSTSPHFLRLDAREALLRALALEPAHAETALRTLDLLIALGEHREALEAAQRSLGAQLLETGDVDPGLLTRGALARVRLFQGEQPAEHERWVAELESCLSSLRKARARAPGEAGLALVEASFLTSLGLPERGALTLLEALRENPSTEDLHRRLIDLCLAEGVEQRLPAVYAELVDRFPGDAMLRWYSGYAELLDGDLAQRELRGADAAAAYERSFSRMAQASVLEPSFTAGARRVQAQAKLGLGWCLLAGNDLAGAQEVFLEVLAVWPDLCEEPDHMGRSPLDAARALGERWVELSDYRAGARLIRRVCALGERDGIWWNNLGFMLREYASQVEGGAYPDEGEAKPRAMEIYREAWQAYLKASELSPEDPRIVNDTALIQIYHLRDELERAERLEWQAIHAGEAQLEAMGPEPDERDRFPVAQAVGDAYQNLAYLEYHLRQRMELAREYFTRSIATDSGDRQQMQEYIDAIDGKRDPMPEYPSATRLPPPEESRPDPAPLAWESSLSLALARAQNERRPLVVYYRGSGLGLAVPYLDRAVTSEAAAALLADCVCVLADRIRHTFVDRRRDGTPVLCPRYGVLTCGEHAAAEADFAAWWSESNGGAAPGESEEGLFLIPWDAEAPGRPAYQLSGADLAARLEGALPPADLDALTARALGGEDRIAAHVLLSSSGRAGRQRAEALLFGEGSNEAARANLIGALGQAMAMDPAWAGLLPRLLSQIADEDLALRAVAAWPAGLDPAPLIHASQWHPSPRVAEAATARLAQDWPGEATQRFLAARELAVGRGEAR